MALANGAIVALDPKRDGVVGRFRVLRVRRLDSRPAPAGSRLARLSLTPYALHDSRAAVLASRDVEIIAEIHHAGKKREGPMIVTLTRAEAPDLVGRWIVERVVLDGRTLPAASFEGFLKIEEMRPAASAALHAVRRVPAARTSPGASSGRPSGTSP